jgi:predicted RNA-binding Zn-ribbon protein involved in translation (DUF1610 family)
MKREYDAERYAVIYTCSHCHYKYADADWEQRKDDEGNEPFIAMQERMHSDASRWHEQDEKHTVYACPMCGILQIEV